MNFNLEIGCEELPHSAIKSAINFFQTKFELELRKNNLYYKKMRTFGTPRRIIVLGVIKNSIQENQDMEILGPDIKIAINESNELTHAGIGFLRAHDTKNYFIKSNGKNNVLAIKIKKIQNDPIKILSELIPKVIRQIQFTKTMKWETTGFKFPRPIRWIYALLNNEIIPFKIAGVTSSNQTCGHRFIASNFENVKQSNYLKFLKKKFVIYDHNKRRKMILEMANQLSKSINGKLKKNLELIETIANSVEYPKINLGIFNKKYLKLPKELLICEMEQHQKYLPIYNLNNTLSPYFIFVSDGISSEKKLVMGNARVLAARLSDGVFCYQQDLENLILKNTNIEIESWVKKISNLLKIEVCPNLQKIASICTFDLASNVVKEFPQLQGIMSSIYAHHKGYNQETCTALYQQYWPKFAGDKIPETNIGCILSLSHRMHTLTTMPISKSDTDAYGTRRAAIGLIKIIIKKKLTINLQDLIENNELLQFIIAKAKGVFLENTTKAIIEATRPKNHFDIYDWYLKIKAIKSINYHPLSILFKRINNILEQRTTSPKIVSKKLLKKPSELLLYKSLLNIKQSKNYKKMLNEFIELEIPINNFFKEVTIMCENKNLRNNRLNLLNEIYNKMSIVADFCKLAT